MLNVQEANESTTYLGLPNLLGRNKSGVLGYLKDKMRERVQGWEKKFYPGEERS